MNTRLRVLGVALLALAPSLWMLDSSGQAAKGKNLVWQPVVPKEDYQELFARCNRILQRELPTLKPGGRAFKHQLQRLRATALLMGALAQSTPGLIKSPALATVRDTALKLSAALDPNNPNLAAANRLANVLPDPKVDPKAKLASVALLDWVNDPEEIMLTLKLRIKGGHGIDPQLQSTPTLRGKGGNGIEEKIRDLTKRQLRPLELKKQAEELALMALQVAVVAQLTQDWTPKIKQQGKRFKDWLRYSQEMRQFALELVTAAKKGTPQQVKTVAGKLTATCNKCHVL